MTLEQYLAKAPSKEYVPTSAELQAKYGPKPTLEELDTSMIPRQYLKTYKEPSEAKFIPSSKYVNVVAGPSTNPKESEKTVYGITGQYPINNNFTGFTDIDAQRLQYELNSPDGDVATAISTGVRGKGKLGPASFSGSVAVPLSKQNAKVYSADFNVPLSAKVKLFGNYQQVDHPYFTQSNNRKGIQYTFDNKGNIKAYKDGSSYTDDYNKNATNSSGINMVYPINKSTKFNVDYNNKNGLAAYLANMQYNF